MKEMKIEAKTIQDAVEKGLGEMSLRRDQVEVVVVSEGKKGLFGFGARPACVVLREKRWGGSDEDRGRGRGDRQERGEERGRGERGERGGRSRRDRGERGERGDRGGRGDRPRRDRSEGRPPRQEIRRPEGPPPELQPAAMEISRPEDTAEHAKQAVVKMMEYMGLPCEIQEVKTLEEGKILVKFESAESAMLLEDNARPMQAMQYLVSSIVNKGRSGKLSVQLDTGGYWERKEKELDRKVEFAVKTVKATGRLFRLEAMPAPMRKYVHNLVKASYPEVETVSEGEGKWRKVVLRPLSGKPGETPAARPEEPKAQETTPAAEAPAATPEEPKAEAQAPSEEARGPETETGGEAAPVNGENEKR
ncbi:MAG: Jag N-terminal domain-containing protein [Elusimicrobiales bacterium]|nr:Jag N-terminal domain-containing protein [Elusimicrobiales bacterium]